MEWLWTRFIPGVHYTDSETVTLRTRSSRGARISTINTAKLRSCSVSCSIVTGSVMAVWFLLWRFSPGVIFSLFVINICGDTTTRKSYPFRAQTTQYYIFRISDHKVEPVQFGAAHCKMASSTPSPPLPSPPLPSSVGAAARIELCCE